MLEKNRDPNAECGEGTRYNKKRALIKKKLLTVKNKKLLNINKTGEHDKNKLTRQEHGQKDGQVTLTKSDEQVS